jgi:hypothetical protein
MPTSELSATNNARLSHQLFPNVDIFANVDVICGVGSNTEATVFSG